MTQRALVVGVLGAVTGVAALAVAGEPRAAVALLDLPAERFDNALVLGGLAWAFAGFSVVAAGLLMRLATLGRRWRSAATLGEASGGTIVVEFALTLPIVLFVVGMVVQIALLANACLVVRYAAFAAARAAIVRFEYPDAYSYTDELSIEPAKIALAAELVLAGISPRASGNGENDAARAIYEIHRAQRGPWGSRSYLQRMHYAQAACRVTTTDRTPVLPPDPQDFIPPFFQSLGVDFDIPWDISIPTTVAPREVSVTVEYDCLLVVPGLSMVPGLTRDAPGGVPGRAFPIRQTVRLQSVGARQSSPAALIPIQGNSPRL